MDQELIMIDVEGRSVTSPPDHRSIIEAIGSRQISKLLQENYGLGTN